MTHNAEKTAPETYTREDMARAWDEGWVRRSEAESQPPSVIPPNPYGRSGTTPLALGGETSGSDDPS